VRRRTHLVSQPSHRRVQPQPRDRLRVPFLPTRTARTTAPAVLPPPIRAQLPAAIPQIRATPLRPATREIALEWCHGSGLRWVGRFYWSLSWRYSPVAAAARL